MLDRGVPLIVNVAAGAQDGEASRERLTALLASHGIRPRLISARGSELLELLGWEIEHGARQVLVAGGDGSVGAAAGVLGGTDVVLGVVPLGTANHFAKDLGIPASLERAVECLANAVVRRVDVASVNGKVFVNNSSIGAYPQLFEARGADARVQRRGRRAALLKALFAALHRPGLLRARLELDGEPVHCITPFVFVGNNAYDGRLLKLDSRSRLDAGKLWVCAVERPERGLLVRIAGGLLRQGVLAEHGLLVRSAERLTVHVDRRRLSVAHDGEFETMALPLAYRVHPRALRVLVPKVA